MAFRLIGDVVELIEIRRELIGYQLMQRDNGVYWRMTQMWEQDRRASFVPSI
ncbi:DUF2087 domain-containing protein [Nostoc sp. 2RC]|uniref:DUF2087 domain-containing protein n=1 Tax=Nostoc sp. 2RC TaxID=2485484 RepID=UPI0016255E57|nr:DUF2087 domain-containing protein [Nostoc sp. 2RC]MBC1237888.1 DUF2087 domain-containing protein [Nostoc sp. 2RC]